MPMPICGQPQPVTMLQQIQPAGQWRRGSCFSSRRTAAHAVSRQPRRLVDAVQPTAVCGSTSTHARLAQQAAAGLAASSLAAALLAAPADAAQLQQLLPPAPQHSSSMQLTSLRRAVVPELSLADVSLPQINNLPSLDNPWQVGPSCPAAATDRKTRPCCRPLPRSLSGHARSSGTAPVRSNCRRKDCCCMCQKLQGKAYGMFT
jgi:hypothetical protein